MTVIVGRPWFAPIVARFVGPLPERVVFTYGRRTYVASGDPLSSDLVAHEAEHTRQQGRFPFVWWLRYLVDRRFRYGQELAAYRVQLAHLRALRTPHVLLARHMAGCLSGPMYGRLCTFDEAIAAIWGKS